MNDDLLDNPFDAELQLLTEPFGALLRPIVSAIGEHGLRTSRLRKFKRDVASYFEMVESLSPRSEVTQALRTRLLKYHGKLFTFLDHDGVPWNNNNAENAIKRFALYRAHAAGMMHEAGVARFLTLLSVCQTCKCKNLSFWRFLLSRQQFDDGYVERKSPLKPSAFECYPEGFNTHWSKGRVTPKKESSSISSRRLGAMGAAIKVLEEIGKPMTAEQLIQKMSSKGYWMSHARQPAQSLKTHMLREIQRKGEAARFQRVGKLKFKLRSSQ
jgi:hypothetical protein